jgi:hypothetical protein
VLNDRILKDEPEDPAANNLKSDDKSSLDWRVSFMHYDLGFIDLEQRTLQPLDNPFAIRV